MSVGGGAGGTEGVSFGGEWLHTASVAPDLYVSPKAKNPKTKPIFPGEVIKLRDATAIGQKVSGTANGSVYTVVALNKRVKLAVKVDGSAISIRAEFDGVSDSEKHNLLAMGMKVKGPEHLSMHIDAETVPPARIVGAFLFDCDVSFDDQAKNLKEIL